MKVTSEERPNREALVTIELEPPDVEAYLERAYRRVVQRANVPGFRKGKAPRQIIEQLYGRDYLLSEAVDFMIPDATDKAVQQVALDVAGTPSVSLDQLDPPRIVATVPLTPNVDLGEYLTVRVDKEPAEVPEERVDQVLEQMRVDLAPWEPVEGETAFGDLVNITVQGWNGQQEIANSKHIDYIPQEGARLPAPGFAEAIAGLTPGQKHEFSLEVPEEGGGPPQEEGEAPKAPKAAKAPKKAAVTYRFKVEVHEVKRKHPAPLDDEFAKGAGEGYESLEALRTKVREDMTQEAERAAAARQQERVMEEVVGHATVELSPLLVDNSVEHEMRDREASLKDRRVTLDQYLQTVGKTEEQLREESRPAAEARIKRELVLREVAKRHEVEVTEEDLKAEVESLASGAATQGDAIRRLFESQEQRESLRWMLQQRKTTEVLVGVASGQVPEKTGPAKPRRKRAAAATKASATRPEDPKTEETGGSRDA